MPNITKDQLIKWNAKAQNGFEFDVMHYLTHGDKELQKYIDLEDDRSLYVRLCYRDVRETYITFAHQPCIHLSIWHIKENGVGVSNSLGKWINIGAQQDKKKYDVLCKLSGIVTDDYALDLMYKHMPQLKNAEITGSQAWS